MHIAENLLQALRLRKVLAVEVSARTPERLAGVIIYPLGEPIDQQAQREGWKASVENRRFHIYWREYSREHMERGWDITSGDGMWEYKHAEVEGEQALEALLNEWGVPLTELTYVWRTNIPE